MDQKGADRVITDLRIQRRRTGVSFTEVIEPVLQRQREERAAEYLRRKEVPVAEPSPAV